MTKKVKNFILPNGEEIDISGANEDLSNLSSAGQAKLDAKANDSTVVHKTGNETIAGTKTFSSTINGNTTSSSKLNGFSSTRNAFWGSVNATAKTGTIINGANTPNDGAYIFSERKLSNGANLDFIIDGKFYQNEGAYQVLDTSTGVTHTANTAVGSASKPVYINSNGVATAITSYDGNSATATKATQDSSGNQINTSYQPLKYSKYSIVTYASSNPYIKLATFTNTATIDHCSILFWVEILQASVNKAYALCKLSLERRNSSVNTSFEILEKYGNSTLCKNFDTLTLAYSIASNTVCEIWMETSTSSYTTYYFRPTECNEYGDYGQNPVTMASNPWTYYNKSGNSTSIASTAITSGYTQVKVTDKSIRYYEPLLSHRWSDHILNDQSWLRADTFSWQNGTTYSSAYNELLSEYNNSASTTETEGNITFKRTPKGYKIALPNQETAILNKYNTDGIAWYYILDTGSALGGKPGMDDTSEESKRFKLPRTKFGFEGLRTSVGDDIKPGLPNITGKFGTGNNNGTWYGAIDLQVDGCFRNDIPCPNPNQYLMGNINGSNTKAFAFDASLSNPIYGNSDTVQPPATQMYLYFYVGNFTKSAEAQTAGLNSELLNSKVDSSSLTECQVVIDTYVNGTSGYRIWSDGYCEQWGRGALSETTTTTITLLKAYKDTNYSVSAISITASTVQDTEVGLQCTPKSATQITLTAHYLNPNNQTACWETKGYLATGEY